MLLNDAQHPFASQLRYRAGAGPCALTKIDGGLTVQSDERPEGLVAARFSGAPGFNGSSPTLDLLVTHHSTNSFSLLRKPGTAMPTHTLRTCNCSGMRAYVSSSSIHTGRGGLVQRTT